MESYKDDPIAMELITQLSIDNSGPSLWHFGAGILKKKGKIYVGSTGGLRLQLIHIFHDSNLGGHSS